MKRRTPEERYQYIIRKEQKTLEDFAEHEIEYADDLLLWHRVRNEDMPCDIYRAVAFFKNREYLRKPGSLTLLYEMSLRCHRELPEVSKENAFDILCFQFKMYTHVLRTGGFS
jgi:hypothetical protein